MAESQQNDDNCRICLNSFIQPRQIDCQHSFCCTCLEDYVQTSSKDGHFPCPLCRVDVTVPPGGVKDFPTITDVAPQCGACKTVVAELRCCDCDVYLCHPCQKMHDMFSSKGHKVVRWDQLDSKGDKPEELDIKGDNSVESQEKLPSTNPVDACKAHVDKVTGKLYCNKCLKAVCLKCFVADHNGHPYVDLEDSSFVKQMRDQLESLNTNFEKRITTFQRYIECLQSKMAEVEAASRTVCDLVDKQIEKICSEVRKIGQKMKADLSNPQNPRMTELIKEFTEQIEDMKASVNTSRGVLNDNSVVEVIEREAESRKEDEVNSTRPLDIPDVHYSFFVPGIINAKAWMNQLGEMSILPETTFQAKFNLDRVKSNPSDKSSQFYLRNKISQSARGYNTSQDTPWSVSVHYKENQEPDESWLAGRLNSESIVISDSFRLKFSFKLLNHGDDSLSISVHDEKTVERNIGFSFAPISYQSFDLPQLVPWKTLTNPDNGFLDEEGNFSLQVTFKLIE